MLAPLELEGHDAAVVVVLSVPVASGDGTSITRVYFPIFVRLANVTTVVGDKRALGKLDDIYTREGEAGDSWVAVVALGREKLIDNSRVAQKCKAKDFVTVVADVRPREEDSEARFQIANDMECTPGHPAAPVNARNLLRT